MRRMQLVVVVAAAVLGTGCLGKVNKRPATADELRQGDVMAQRMVDALGGMEAFRKLRHIGFDSQLKAAGFTREPARIDWDPQRNIARVAFKNDDLTTVYLDLGTRRGVVYERNVKLTDSKRIQEEIDDAYAQWVNDTYWLVSPFKIFDDGVRRAVIDGKLRISFEGVGLTPGDAYMYELAPDGKPLRWHYKLQNGLFGTNGYAEPLTRDGVTLYADRPGLFSFHFDNLEFGAQARPEVFAPFYQ